MLSNNGALSNCLFNEVSEVIEKLGTADNLRLKPNNDQLKQRELIYSNLKPNNKCHYTAVTSPPH